MRIGSCSIRPFGVAAGLVLTLAVYAGAPRYAHAQDSGGEALQQIEAAFARGDSRVLLETASERIEIALFETSTLFSRAQATYVLDAFFRQYPPKRCSFDQPVKAGDSWFAGGRYWYRSAERPLKLYVGLRHQGGRWELREIRIDEGRTE